MRLGVSIDHVVTHGKRCGSALSLAGLILSVLIDEFTHSVRSRSFVVELLRWAGCPEVLGREQH